MSWSDTNVLDITAVWLSENYLIDIEEQPASRELSRLIVLICINLSIYYMYNISLLTLCETIYKHKITPLEPF